MVLDCPRVAFTALRGNSGKTLLTVGITAHLHNEGKVIAPFKKGPDYIDAAWLALAAGRPCYNLDVFLMGKEEVIASFATHGYQADARVVEGNRGLFDGMDAQGSYSTAELAKMLRMPVILIVDCSMATRTLAAMILGCQHFDRDVSIEGVILNRIRGSRHESIIRTSIEENCGIPVLGALPKIKGRIFPERHMGLVPPQEHPEAGKAVEKVAGIAERYIDVERIWEIALDAPSLDFIDHTTEIEEKEFSLSHSKRPRIGFIRDSAFWFYYPDNLDALKKLGAEIVECNALLHDELPPLDALYIGGGFPETHAETLASNDGFRRSLRQAIERGLPVYAECGGLVYLGEKLIIDERKFPMVGVFPLTFALQQRPKGHGYTIMEVDRPNPYFEVGEILCGHEFHYSIILGWDEEKFTMAFKVKRGYGVDGRRDGLCYKNVLATYSHIHALGTKGWAEGLFDQAVYYSQRSVKNREDKSLLASRFHAALNF